MSTSTEKSSYSQIFHRETQVKETLPISSNEIEYVT